MRTRAKLNQQLEYLVTGALDRKDYSYPQGVFVVNNPRAGIPSGEIAYIEDETMTDDISKGRRFKSVIHQKRKFRRINQTAPFTEHMTTGSPQRELRWTGNNALWYSWGRFGEIQSTSVKLAFPSTEGAHRARALGNFYKVNQVDTLLNAIESPSLISGLSGLKSGGLKSLSSGYLYYQFGLAPLISDITKVWSSLKDLRKEIDIGIKNAGKPASIATRELGSFNGFENMSSGYSATSGTGWWHASHNVIHAPTRIVTIRGIRSYPYSSDLLRRLDYILGRFGSAGPASLLWERIPFSFVLDWFLDISSVLGSLNSLLQGNKFKIIDCSQSIKWHSLINVIKHDGDGWAGSLDGQIVAWNELSYYHRESITINPSIEVNSRFGKKQASLTLALLHQIVANRR